MPNNTLTRLEELLKKGTQGARDVNTLAGKPHREVFCGRVLICDCGDTNVEMSDEEIEANAQLIAELHNAAPALIAIARATQAIAVEYRGGKLTTLGERGRIRLWEELDSALAAVED